MTTAVRCVLVAVVLSATVIAINPLESEVEDLAFVSHSSHEYSQQQPLELGARKRGVNLRRPSGPYSIPQDFMAPNQIIPSGPHYSYSNSYTPNVARLPRQYSQNSYLPPTNSYLPTKGSSLGPNSFSDYQPVDYNDESIPPSFNYSKTPVQPSLMNGLSLPFPKTNINGKSLKGSKQIVNPTGPDPFRPMYYGPPTNRPFNDEVAGPRGQILSPRDGMFPQSAGLGRTPNLPAPPPTYGSEFPQQNGDTFDVSAQNEVVFTMSPDTSEYFFSYIVADPVQGHYFRHQQLRVGDVVTGFYIIIHPDTHVETVGYQSDSNGDRKSTKLTRYTRSINKVPADA